MLKQHAVDRSQSHEKRRCMRRGFAHIQAIFMLSARISMNTGVNGAKALTVQPNLRISAARRASICAWPHLVTKVCYCFVACVAALAASARPTL